MSSSVAVVTTLTFTVPPSRSSVAILGDLTQNSQHYLRNAPLTREIAHKDQYTNPTSAIEFIYLQGTRKKGCPAWEGKETNSIMYCPSDSNVESVMTLKDVCSGGTPRTMTTTGDAEKHTMLKTGCSYITPLGHYTILVIKNSLFEVF